MGTLCWISIGSICDFFIGNCYGVFEVKKIYLFVILFAFILPVSVRAAGMALVSPRDVTLTTSFYDYVWLEDDDPDVTQYVIYRKINEVNQIEIFVNTSACVGGTCTRSVTGQETANYVWWVESVDSFYSTINTTGYADYVVDLGDIQEVENPITTSSAPDLSNLHCPEETPANWGTATPNPLWDVTCSHCFEPALFPTSEQSGGTPTPFGYPTQTPLPTPNVTATYVAEQELWFQHVGSCYVLDNLTSLQFKSCPLDISSYHPLDDLVGVIYTNIFVRTSPNAVADMYTGNCGGACSPYVGDSHAWRYVLYPADGFHDILAFDYSISDGYDTHDEIQDFVSDYFGGRPVYPRFKASYPSLKTMTSVSVSSNNGYVSFASPIEIAYDAYLLRYSIPWDDVPATPTAQPAGPGYCSVIDDTEYADLFDYTGLDYIGAPVCLRLGSEVNLLGIYIDLNSLFSFFQIPELFELCFQGVALGSFTIFGMAVDTEGILIIVGILTFVRWFTRK